MFLLGCAEREIPYSPLAPDNHTRVKIQRIFVQLTSNRTINLPAHFEATRVFYGGKDAPQIKQGEVLVLENAETLPDSLMADVKIHYTIGGGTIYWANSLNK